MIVKLSKSILYAGIAITIGWQLFEFVMTRNAFGNSNIYYLTSLFDIVIFLINIVLLNEILRQVKKNYSFTIWFILLFFTRLIARIITLIPSDFISIDFSFNWIFMLLYWPIAISIPIKYFQLEGKLSDLFKIFGAFELLAILSGIFINIAYRFVGVSGSEQIQWVFMGLNFITTFLLCYIFFESTKYLDENSEMSDNDILDNI